MKIEEWLAQINGQVDALVMAVATLTVTHQDPDKVLTLLCSILKKATKEEADLPTQKAYKIGTAKAVQQLFAAVELAKKTQRLESEKKN
ncbi:MAG: hypothetical protein WC762_03010 [Methylobacter sp.]|jgi:hypothetical protein